MIRFSAAIKKYDNKGQKSDWRYIELPFKLAEQLKLNTKFSFVLLINEAKKLNAISSPPLGDGGLISLPIYP